MRPCLLAAVGLLLAAGVAGARPAPVAAAASCAEAGGAARTGANRLLATPWQGLSSQYERDTVSGIEGALEGKRLFDETGRKGELKWSFWLKTKNVSSSASYARPPGFAALTPECVDVRVPLDGGWSFRFAATVDGRARVKIANETLFSWSPSGLRIGLTISDFRLAARAELDARDPTRPRLERAVFEPRLTITGGGMIPFDLEIALRTVVRPNGRIELVGNLANVGFSAGPLSARFTGQLVLTLRPSGFTAGAVLDLEHDVGSDLRESEYVVGDTVRVSSAFQDVDVTMRGSLSARLDRVGRVKVPWSLTFPAVIPSSSELITLQNAVQRGGLPITWGEGVAEGRAERETRAIDWAGTARIVETGAAAHMPWGTLLSRDTPGRGLPAWSQEEDAAIWTGHYLAAESFRYAATGEPQALANVDHALSGIERLFAVPAGGAVATTPPKRTRDGRTTYALAGAARPGVLARVVAPAGEDRFAAGPLSTRKCYYVWPEGGWRAGGRTYARYSQIPGRIAQADAQPVGKIWHGWGCGKDHPVSRDQYAGVFLGLRLAHRLVGDPAVRARSDRLIRQALDYLLEHDWNVVLPPGNRIQTSFLGDFAKQLSFLAAGVEVDETRYGHAYAQVAGGAGATWLPSWFSSLDPLHQYYKFNLSHAALVPLLMTEADPARRAGYEAAYELLWRGVAHHRNAYFGLMRILARPSAAREPSASNPALTLADDVRAALAQWIDRRAAVPGPFGLPLESMSDAAVAYHVGLLPDGVAGYRSLVGATPTVARFALPVHLRTGKGTSFTWQRHPFDLGLGPRGTRATADDIRAAGSRPRREGPGVDYLLPYWLGVYLGVLPRP